MKSSTVDAPVTSELLFSVHVTGLFFPLLPSLYVFVVNSVGLEIQMSSHRREKFISDTVEQSCITALCLWISVSSGDCGTVVVAQKKIQGKPDGHRVRLLCSAKSAVICNDSSKQASSSSHQDADMWSLLEAELRHSILMLNIQKIKIVYRWYWKERFEEILKLLNL